MLSAAPATHAGGIEPVQNFNMQPAGQLVSLPHFDLMNVLELVEERQITILLLAPTMAIALLKAPGERPIDWSGMKCVQCGARPVPAELKEIILEATDHWITTLYGMSETARAVDYFTARARACAMHRCSPALHRSGNPQDRRTPSAGGGWRSWRNLPARPAGNEGILAQS